MKKILISVFSGIILSLIVAPFTYSQKTDRSKVSKNKNSALLYKITGKGLKKPSYVYGTVHIMCKDDVIPVEKFTKYVDQTEQMVLELDMDSPELLPKMTAALTAKRDDNVADYLTTEEIEKIDVLIKDNFKVPFEAVKQSHPFALIQGIMISPKNLGCDATASYDKNFADYAVKNKMEITGLESVETQIGAINSTTTKEYAKQLSELAADPEKKFAYLKELMEAYKTQDSKNIYGFMQQAQKESPAFQKTFLDDRNVEWIPQIEKLMKTKPIFIAVGAGHLDGDSGVVTQLRKRGYKVTPIKI